MKRLAIFLGLCLSLGPWALHAESGPPPPGPPPLPALGPIPSQRAPLEPWLRDWPRWVQCRQWLENDLGRLRQRLQDQGEAEARRGQSPTWWNLPSRQRQTARLRYLQRLRAGLERGEAQLFQISSIETQWRLDLEQRESKNRLPEALKPVLKDLQKQAEKSLLNKEESH